MMKKAMAALLAVLLLGVCAAGVSAEEAEETQPVTYTLKFYDSGKEMLAPIIKTHGAPVQLPPDIPKGGLFKFLGWRANEENGKLYKPSEFYYEDRNTTFHAYFYGQDTGRKIWDFYGKWFILPFGDGGFPMVFLFMLMAVLFMPIYMPIYWILSLFQ